MRYFELAKISSSKYELGKRCGSLVQGD